MTDKNSVGRMWQLYKLGGIAPAVSSVFNSQTAQQMAFIRSLIKEQRKSEMHQMELKRMEYAVLDLETTGFSPYNGDEIISVGVVSMIGDSVQENEKFYSLVKTKRKIPAHVERLTGISSEMTRQAPELINVLRNVLEFVQKRVLIVHGSGHDKHFLNSALWKTCRVNLSHRLIDCMIVAKCLNPASSRYDLDFLLEDYQIPLTTRHHALEDALMTAHLWREMLDRLGRKEIVTLGDLYARLSGILN